MEQPRKLLLLDHWFKSWKKILYKSPTLGDLKVEEPWRTGVSFLLTDPFLCAALYVFFLLFFFAGKQL